MWAGTSALQSIDKTLHIIRSEVLRLDGQVNQLTHDMANNVRHRAKLYADIAAVRLAEIDSGELSESMSAADKQVEQFLAQRDIALQKIHKEIEVTNSRLEQAEQEREHLLESVNQKSQEIVELEGQVQNQLKHDAAYIEQFERAKHAELVAGEAQTKQASAKASLSAKAAPYRADDLFMYLWDRGYGTTEYKGGLFSRFMDSWVAKLIRYEPARVNFWNVTEIPKRLAEHAQRVADIAGNEYESLQLLEAQAIEAAGINELENELTQRRDKLDAHDDAIDDIETKLNDKLDERTLYTTGADEYMQQSLACLTRALEHKSLQSIVNYVTETVSHTDDMLVIELQQVDDQLDNVEEDLQDVRTLHNAQVNKLKDLEKVRRDFKHSRYDDVRSGFGNQTLITSVLNQFVQGTVKGGAVWKVIKRNQRYRKVASSPNFGSSALGEIASVLGEELLRQTTRQGRRRRPTWHRPRPRGGSGGFNFPRGGGSGGFKTGGGF